MPAAHEDEGSPFAPPGAEIAAQHLRNALEILDGLQDFLLEAAKVQEALDRLELRLDGSL